VTRVELHIEELVVTGTNELPAQDVVAGLEAELRRRLVRASVDALAAGGDRGIVSAPDVRLARGARPERAGAEIARQVGGALGWW
jgi:hypothetical protein